MTYQTKSCKLQWGKENDIAGDVFLNIGKDNDDLMMHLESSPNEGLQIWWMIDALKYDQKLNENHLLALWGRSGCQKSDEKKTESHLDRERVIVELTSH